MNAGSAPSIADYFEDLKLPDVREMELHLEKLVQQGVIQPEEARTIMLEQTKMNEIKDDPRLAQAEMQALESLQGIASEGGLNAQSRAKLAQIASQESAQNRGGREAILQQMQARGLGGNSGIGLQAQFQNQQDSAMRQSQRDMDIAALAEQQALQAIMSGGQLAGNMQQNQFNRQAQIAGANDAIAKFNAQNQQSQINQNVGARNTAQAQNLANAQDIANQNVGLSNQQQKHNKVDLKQLAYENELKKRQGQAGIAAQNAQIGAQNAASKQGFTGGLISTAGSIYGGYLGGRKNE